MTFPIEKYKDFFCGLILMGSPAQVKKFSKVKPCPGQKFLKSEKFSKVFSIFGYFEVAFLLMDLIEDFSCEFLRNTLFNI
jgi:hypothetical protein